MWNTCDCLVALLCCLALSMLGCSREIGEITLEMVPNHGCAPLEVQLRAHAETRAGLKNAFNWTIGKGVQLRGPAVVHTFATPGTYDISLTIAGEKQTKTRGTTIVVNEAELPRVLGLYRQMGCVYQAIKAVQETQIVKRLGKTSLQDLEQRIVGKKLSTRELVTHPLWRREHTHTLSMVDRDQFVDIPLDAFHVLGFVAVGEDLSEAAVFRVRPSPEPAPVSQHQVVTRLVDSWGLENVDPEPQTLRRTRILANAWRYVPAETLTEGLYFLVVRSEDNGRPGISPVALVASNP
ncbi:hypothetical protein NKDENANG_03311 [Candidatus Entotheonellaceae bacterium PAL068K]